MQVEFFCTRTKKTWSSEQACTKNVTVKVLTYRVGYIFDCTFFDRLVTAGGLDNMTRDHLTRSRAATSGVGVVQSARPDILRA